MNLFLYANFIISAVSNEQKDEKGLMNQVKQANNDVYTQIITQKMRITSSLENIPGEPSSKKTKPTEKEGQNPSTQQPTSTATNKDVDNGSTTSTSTGSLDLTRDGYESIDESANESSNLYKPKKKK